MARFCRERPLDCSATLLATTVASGPLRDLGDIDLDALAAQLFQVSLSALTFDPGRPMNHTWLAVWILIETAMGRWIRPWTLRDCPASVDRIADLRSGLATGAYSCPRRTSARPMF